MKCDTASRLLLPKGFVAAALLLGALPAWAQPAPDAARRRELLERAVAARDADDQRTALTLFLEAGAIQMRPGLRMSIAQAQQALGQSADACVSATRCIEELGADPGAADPRVQEGCSALMRTVCSTPAPLPVPARPSPARTEPLRVAPANQGESTEATRVPQTPHPRETGGERAPAAASSSRWWLWTGLSVLVVGGVLGGLAAGGVFDTPGPAIGGTAYTVEALFAR